MWSSSVERYECYREPLLIALFRFMIVGYAWPLLVSCHQTLVREIFPTIKVCVCVSVVMSWRSGGLFGYEDGL